MKNDTIIVGRIQGCHGLKGELKVLPLTDDPDRFFDLDQVKINTGNNWEAFKIEGIRRHKNHVLMFLEEIKDRTEAEKLAGKEMAIHRDLAVSLGKDEFFVEDLLGMEVYNEELLLGKITDILQTGGIDVYIIEGGKKIYSIPARKIYFKTFNFEKNTIEGNIPQEILDL